MKWKALQSAIAILAIVAGQGCNYSTAPRPLGTFVLVNVGGERLPTSTMTQPGETVLSDTLVVFGVSKGASGASSSTRPTNTGRTSTTWCTLWTIY